MFCVNVPFIQRLSGGSNCKLMSEMNDVNIKDVLNKFVFIFVMFKSVIKLAYK